eukprot:scaffold112_cov282-Prasinococcus_capsulatus_cf.AAC.16
MTTSSLAQVLAKLLGDFDWFSLVAFACGLYVSHSASTMKPLRCRQHSNAVDPNSGYRWGACDAAG